MTQEELDQLTTDEGYRVGAPRGGLIGAAACDREACAASTCAECHHTGLGYEPRIKEGSYRAFAVCPRCGWICEF